MLCAVLIFSLGTFFAFPHEAYAAAAFDATANTTCASGCTVITYSHTVGAGVTNGAMYIAVGYTTAQTISAVSYNGVAATLITNATNGTNRIGEYYVTGIATGAHTVSVTTSASGGNSLKVGSISMSGIDQVTPIDASASSTGSAATQTTNITTLTTGTVLVGSILSTGGTVTTDASQTLDWSGASNCGAGQSCFGAHRTSTTGAPGAYFIKWTAGGAVGFAQAIAAFKAAASPTNTTTPSLVIPAGGGQLIIPEQGGLLSIP